MSKKYHGKLHIYSQYSPHDDAVIVGDKGALAALRDAITQALEAGEAKFNSFTNDGEGFTTIVKYKDTEHFYNNVGLPYTADFYAQGGSLDPRDPDADNLERFYDDQD